MRLRNAGTICMVCAALFALATPALAQSAAAPTDWKARFRSYDRNGDACIDREEFQQWMTEAFYFRDTGRKGYLTLDDLRGVMAPETLRALTEKNDGKLTLPEFLNAAFQDFQAADTNRNGCLTMDEIERYAHPGG